MPLYRPNNRRLYIKPINGHDEQEGDEVHEDLICRECAGSGIGAHGDPETSRCWACNGSGMEQTE